jgi:hypothetical protein
MLHNKRTNYFREQVKSTLNTQMSLKDYNDIIQAMQYFNVTIQQIARKSIPSCDIKEHHISTFITIREKLQERCNLRKKWQYCRS